MHWFDTLNQKIPPFTFYVGAKPTACSNHQQECLCVPFVSQEAVHCLRLCNDDLYFCFLEVSPQQGITYLTVAEGYMAGTKRIERLQTGLKAVVLPLNYVPIDISVVGMQEAPIFTTHELSCFRYFYSKHKYQLLSYYYDIYMYHKRESNPTSRLQASMLPII